MKTIHLVLLLALLVVVVFFPLRILQFVILLYAAVIGFSYLYSRIIRRYVVVRRQQQVLRTHRFDPIEIILIVENRSPLPVAYINVIDEPNYFFASEPGNFLLKLRPGERRVLSYPIESQQRGQYSVGPAVIQGSDPLGLFPFRKRCGRSQSLIVYPEVLPLDLHSYEGLPAGSIRVENPIYEDMTRYRSLREYMPGDSLRRVNWKSSAKTGQLFVMDYLPRLLAPVLILLDLDSEDYPMRHRYHRIERAAALAASLVVHFLSLRQEIGLIASARIGQDAGFAAAEIRGTHEHATTILEILARMEPVRGGATVTELLFTAGIEVPVRTRIEVITPVLSDLDGARLRQIKGRGCTVEIFLFGEQQQLYRQRYAGQFPIHSIADFGNELVHQ
ncbi:MAG: DUF58 domain-containing protein [Spirochaetales bacterium]|nr:DUF58 domain-containing protein [Spirochaetales bacterium]